MLFPLYILGIVGLIVAIWYLPNPRAAVDFLYNRYPADFARLLITTVPPFLGIGIGGMLGLLSKLTHMYLTCKKHFENLTVEVLPQGIKYGSSDFNFFFDWALVKKATKTKHLLLIRAKHSIAFAFIGIPTRAFKNKEELDNFFQSVEEYIKPVQAQKTEGG